MDILQSLGSLLGQGMGGATNQYAQPSASQNSALGGLGSLLTPEVLGGLAGALFPSNKTGGRNLGIGTPSGDSGLGGMLSSILSGAMGGSANTAGSAGGMGGLGALGGLLGSLLGGGAEQPAPGGQPQSNPQIDNFSRQYANRTPARPEDRVARMLRTVIYAAKADGHIDAQEQAVITSQLKKLDVGPEGQSFVNQVLQEQIDPNAIASGVADSNEAIQIYALSCALTNMDNVMEINYLNALASALRIPDNVKAAIEAKTKR